jgi:trimeric autotransporter adhesin
MASKSYRKFMATGLSAAVVASVVAPVAGAASFDDVKPGSWYEGAVNYVTENGYMNGTDKGFEPMKPLTRAEAAGIFANRFDLYDTNLEADFSDVKDGAWYHNAVAAVSENGIMGSTGNEMFSPDRKITRGEMAALIVRAYGFEVEGEVEHTFTDIEGNMFENDIATLVAWGITNGKTDELFAPGDTVSRAEMAAFIQKADEAEAPIPGPVVESVKAIDATSVEVTLEGTYTQEEVDALIAAGYELTVVAGDDVHEVGKVTVKAAEAAASADTTTLVLSEISPELPAGVELSLAVNGEVVEGTEFEYEAPATPEVTSVSAINLKEVVVKFNTELDKDSVTKDKFKLDGLALAANDTVELNEDGKSVTITLDTEFVNQTTFEVTVSGVKNLQGTALAETTVSATAFDTTVPTVLSTSQVGPSTIKVVFSEPVKTALAGNFKVDGGQYFIDGSSLSINGNVVTFDLFTTIPDGEHTVSVNGVKDFADYSVVATDSKFVAAKDAVAPSVTKVVKATPEQVILEFNEDISLDAAAAVANFYHTNTGNTVDVAGFSVINGNQLKLDFTTNTLPKGTAYLYVSKDIIKDGWNNKSEAIAITVDVAVDSVKPVVSKVESADDQTIKLTFSEDVDVTTAENELNYTILNGSGEKVNTTFTATASGSAVTLAFNSPLAGSDYTVVVDKVEDLSGNAIDKVSVKAPVKDTSAPAVADLVTGGTEDGYLYGSKKIVKISFTEAINQSDLLNLSNYKLDGGKYLSEYNATASVADNGKSVLIDLSKESSVTLADGDDIVVGKVRDVAGNASANLSTLVNLADQDATGIAIDSVEATGTKTLKVTLADALSSFEADDFAIEDESGIAITASGVTFANVDGKGVITFTLTNALDTDATVADAPGVPNADGLVVTTVASLTDINSKNSFGVKVANSQASLAADDKIAAAITSATFATDSTIDVVFSEAIDETTISKYTLGVSGNTVTGFAYNALTNTATLTLKDAVTTVGTKVKVTQALELEDSVGNKVTGLEKEVTR